MKNILFGLITLLTVTIAQAQDSKHTKEEVVCFYVDAEHIACMKVDENSPSKNGRSANPKMKDTSTRRKSDKITNGELTRDQYEELYLRQIYAKEKEGLDI